MRQFGAMLCAALAMGCGGPDRGLTVSAAASLQPALTQISRMYPVPLILNFGGSGMLAQQIEQGAPADVFFSADSQTMDRLSGKGLLAEGSRRDLLRNGVVLIAPAASAIPSGFAGLTEASVKLIALGDPAFVPAGRYAKQALVSMDLWNSVQPKLLLAKDVRQVLAYVETGNADAGIVYSTDARTSRKVRVAATAPEAAHDPAVYPVAVLARSPNAAEAGKLVRWLAGPRARDVFVKFGFTVVGE